jgi:hypothetical protein
VDNKGGVKITDFGISKKVEEGICLITAIIIIVINMLTSLLLLLLLLLL